jgi:exosome complex RNA-binding protein Rrp42 (RNase PH superfamily)
MKKLVIKEGERVWELFIDAYVVNDDGNLIDASAAGAIAALKKAKMPVYKKKEDAIDKDAKRTKKLPLLDEPVAVTVAKIGEYLLPDPTKKELEVSDATLTITLNSKNEIVSLQKGGSNGLSLEEIEKCLKIAKKISKDIRAKIK